jgi:hypothetical protein
MAKLVYSAITSLDGYTADVSGNIGWAAPDAEVHSFVNGLERGIGTYLYGRKISDAPPARRQAPGSLGHRHCAQAPSRRARAKTASSIGSVSTPVNVFC